MSVLSIKFRKMLEKIKEPVSNFSKPHKYDLINKCLSRTNIGHFLPYCQFYVCTINILHQNVGFFVKILEVFSKIKPFIS